MDYLLQQLINGIVIGSTYAIVAIGFSLVFTVMRVVNFAHPDVFMLGMFAGLFAGQNVSDNIFFVLVCGAAGAAIVGVVVERIVLRPLHKRNVLMGLIATLGVSFVISNGMAVLVSPDPVPFPQTIEHSFLIEKPILLSSKQLLNLTIAAVLLIGVSYYVRCTRFGRATRALAELPDVAAAFGVDTARVSQLSVLIASIMAGMAAVSVGVLYSSAYVFVGTLYGLKSFICMLVAGNRHFEGVIVVALLLGVLEVLVIGYISSAYRDAVAFSLLILVLSFFPQGLFGSYSLAGDKP
jgi:branched-chain amino acid transport system permease protein